MSHRPKYVFESSDDEKYQKPKFKPQRRAYRERSLTSLIDPQTSYQGFKGYHTNHLTHWIYPNIKLRYIEDPGRIANTLFSSLAELVSPLELMTLRTVCQIWNEWIIGGLKAGGFSTLYIVPREENSDTGDGRKCKKALEHIAKHCTQLVVDLSHLASSSGDISAMRIFRDFDCAESIRSSEQNYAQSNAMSSLGISRPRPPSPSLPYTTSEWPTLFMDLPNLRTLTIRTETLRPMAGWNTVAHTLVAIRVGIEATGPDPDEEYGWDNEDEEDDEGAMRLTTIRLAPFHASYIPFLQWSGPALGVANPRAAAVWDRIKEVEVQLCRKISDKSPHQDITMLKSIQSWLRSFNPTLQALKWHWLDWDGAHPLGIDLILNTRDSSAPWLVLPQLRELWIGRCDSRVERDVIRTLLKERARKLQTYLVLWTWGSERSWSERDRLLKFAMGDMDLEAWEDVSEVVHREEGT
jgi:hypothetical protein